MQQFIHLDSPLNGTLARTLDLQLPLFTAKLHGAFGLVKCYEMVEILALSSQLLDEARRDLKPWSRSVIPYLPYSYWDLARKNETRFGSYIRYYSSFPSFCLDFFPKAPAPSSKTNHQASERRKTPPTRSDCLKFEMPKNWVSVVSVNTGKKTTHRPDHLAGACCSLMGSSIVCSHWTPHTTQANNQRTLSFQKLCESSYDFPLILWCLIIRSDFPKKMISIYDLWCW